MDLATCIRCGKGPVWTDKIIDGDIKVERRMSSPFRAVELNGERKYVHWSCIKEDEKQ